MALRPTCLTAAIAASLLLAPSAHAADEAPTAAAPVTTTVAAPVAAPDAIVDAALAPEASDATSTAAVPTDDAAAAAAVADAEPVAEVPAAAAAPALDYSSLQHIKITAGLGIGPDGNRFGDPALRLVMRSDTATVTAAKVGLFALAALTGAGGQGNTFTKNNVRGDSITAVPSPSFGLLPGMIREQLAIYFAAHPGAIPSDERTIEASAGQWSLVYQKLNDADTPYELRHDATIGFPVVRKLFRSASGGQGVHCRDEARVAPLQEWQADDYAKAKAASREFADACIARFVAELPRLFPDHGVLPETVAEPELPTDTPAVTEEATAVTQA
ncbi:TPA: hypothetical protein QDZ34_003823 [Stenotrophomonas maltophilia]|nr:hypothetical protein [Stenotrophomonas maltophilia]HDS1027314.1 hypothetical protein [Stenotrophomonas maltophilia]HDS1031252.1 hypothetical protein [Stenotrophomonas maltophilia]HDS1036428.1 hypothetical protein [Stenotrophomonas maltophilia]